MLAAARSAALRRWVTSALTPEFAVCEKDPKDLTDTAPLLDAVAAVVWLDSEDDIESLEILGSINRLPCSNHVILMIDNVDEEILAAALDRLAPTQVVGLPTRPMVLRYAVRNTIPGPTPGQGARANHRPAPALLGVSSAIREVIDQVRQIAPTNIPALILGETGTGKELVARAIHEQSPRASGPFVAVNCGAMPDSLLESELFGHRRGSFTGAHTDKSGLFEYADGGTIFLDEVGDTSPALQMKLLRVLENKEVRPLGDTRTIYVDVRIVSATTAISKHASKRVRSARTSTTGSMRPRSTFHRCGVDASISRFLPSTSLRNSESPTRAASLSVKISSRASASVRSPEMFGSCGTRLNVPSPWRRRAKP